MRLQYSSQESLREIEPRQPESVRIVVLQPCAHHLYTLNEIFKPGTEWLKRSIGDLLPNGGQLVIQKA